MEEDYDFYQWSAILRSVSAFEVYRKVYRDVITPVKVAELLILRADMPRSLAALHQRSGEQPQRGRQRPLGRNPALGRQAARRSCSFARIDEILATGLHAYLTQFLDRVNELGKRISDDFLVPVGR